ncbi:hypothetical protein ACH4UM_41565 [Streptomyces sp. NPDC020801]|uniref:hypothetical protein n=1 Tax=Streptomyces sp. NPDC020801 TaxID=3365093 RepID=UPI0037B57866
MTTESEHTNPAPDLTVPLAAADAQALGDDAQLLAALLGRALHGVAMLRTGRTSLDDLTDAIEGTTELLERLEGARRAEVREFAAQKGTHGTLAKAMRLTNRATAQSRRRTLLREEPSAMERWATGSS